MNNITDDDIANILHSEGWNITIRDFLEKLFGIERTIYILGRASALNRGDIVEYEDAIDETYIPFEYSDYHYEYTGEYWKLVYDYESEDHRIAAQLYDEDISLHELHKELLFMDIDIKRHMNIVILWLSIYKHYFPYDEDEYDDDERNWYNGEYWD